MIIKQTAVYQIRNLVNGRRYIGSSVNIHERFADHRRELNTNKHANRHLQAAWVKYGSNAFIFEVIMPCAEENVLLKEQEAIDKAVYSSGWDALYNLSRKANAPMYGRSHSEEARKKISNARKLGKNNMLGKKHSNETLALMSRQRRGKNHWTYGLKTEEHPRYGSHLSDDTKRKIGFAHKGKKRGPLPLEVREKLSVALRGRHKPPRSAEHIKHWKESICKIQV